MKYIVGIAAQVTVPLRSASHLKHLKDAAILRVQCHGSDWLIVPVAQVPMSMTDPGKYLVLMSPIPLDMAVVTHPAWLNLVYKTEERK